MLVADPTGEFRAYDRACPVEARRDAVVVFDADTSGRSKVHGVQEHI